MCTPRSLGGPAMALLVLVAAMATLIGHGRASAQGTRQVTVVVALPNGANVPGAGELTLGAPIRHCRDLCTWTVPTDRPLIVSASAGRGYRFERWTGPRLCTDRGEPSSTCTIAASQDDVVIGANFVA